MVFIILDTTDASIQKIHIVKADTIEAGCSFVGINRSKIKYATVTPEALAKLELYDKVSITKCL